MLSEDTFNLILAYYAACGLITMLLAFIGGKASVGMRIGMGVVGAILAGYAGYVYLGEVNTVLIGGRLAILPILLVIIMAVGMAKGSGKQTEAPPATGPAGPAGPAGFPTAGGQPGQAPQQGFPVAGGQPGQFPQAGQQYPQSGQQYPQAGQYPGQAPYQAPPQQYGQQYPPPPAR